MFHDCKNEQEVKTLYRKLSMRLHPDHGGSDELMKLLTDAKERRSQEIQNGGSVRDDEIEEIKKAYEEAWTSFTRAQRRHESGSSKWNTRAQKPHDNGTETVKKGDDRLSILEDILLYASHHPSFNIEFIKSIKQYLTLHGFVTMKQYNALVKIINSFNISEWKKEFDEEKKAPGY